MMNVFFFCFVSFFIQVKRARLLHANPNVTIRVKCQVLFSKCLQK